MPINKKEHRKAMEISIREITKNDLTKVAELFDLYRQFYEQVPDGDRAYLFIHWKI